METREPLELEVIREAGVTRIVDRTTGRPLHVRSYRLELDLHSPDRAERMLEILTVSVALMPPQAETPSPPQCSEAEIDGLPSVATAAPAGPHDPPDPTAEERHPAAGSMVVMDTIVSTCLLPDGRPVDRVAWINGTQRSGMVRLMFRDNIYLLFARDGDRIEVWDENNGHHVRTAVCWELEEVLNQAGEAVRAGVMVWPSGPREGLQEPTSPQSPMDAGYDDWTELVNRVNASDFRPWLDPGAGWCARSPATQQVRIFGRSDADAAYRWVHGLLGGTSS